MDEQDRERREQKGIRHTKQWARTDPARAGTETDQGRQENVSPASAVFWIGSQVNTAPELEQLNGTVEDGDEIGYSGARATMFHTQTQNGGLSESPETGACLDASLKRSSSMFIPQLQGQTEPTDEQEHLCPDISSTLNCTSRRCIAL